MSDCLKTGNGLKMKNGVKTLLEFLLEMLIASVVAGAFLMFMPTLSRLQRDFRERGYQDTILLTVHKPPKPPDLERERTKELKPRKVKRDRELDKRQVTKPKIDLPRFNLGMGNGLTGGMLIASPSLQSKDLRGGMRTVFRLSEVDKPPRVIRKIDPRYPFAAKRKGIEGNVKLRLVVNKNGIVTDIQIMSADPEGIFESSAITAAKRWRFRPAIKDGRAVNVIVELPLVFSIQA